MCSCGRTNLDYCNNCNNDYQYHKVTECDPCEGSTPKCTKTIDAKCVINKEDLDFLGVEGKDNIDLQTILISINNALNSISNALCIDYERVVDAETGIADYTHTLNMSCIAQHVCPICNEE